MAVSMCIATAVFAAMLGESVAAPAQIAVIATSEDAPGVKSAASYDDTYYYPSLKTIARRHQAAGYEEMGQIIIAGGGQAAPAPAANHQGYFPEPAKMTRRLDVGAAPEPVDVNNVVTIARLLQAAAGAPTRPAPAPAAKHHQTDVAPPVVQSELLPQIGIIANQQLYPSAAPLEQVVTVGGYDPAFRFRAAAAKLSSEPQVLTKDRRDVGAAPEPVDVNVVSIGLLQAAVGGSARLAPAPAAKHHQGRYTEPAVTMSRTSADAAPVQSEEPLPKIIIANQQLYPSAAPLEHVLTVGDNDPAIRFRAAAAKLSTEPQVLTNVGGQATATAGSDDVPCWKKCLDCCRRP